MAFLPDPRSPGRRAVLGSLALAAIGASIAVVRMAAAETAEADATAAPNTMPRSLS